MPSSRASADNVAQGDTPKFTPASLDRLNVEALEIEQVKFPKPPVGRLARTVSNRVDGTPPSETSTTRASQLGRTRAPDVSSNRFNSPDFKTGDLASHSKPLAATPAPAARIQSQKGNFYRHHSTSAASSFPQCGKPGPSPRIKPVIARDTTYSVSLLTATTGGSNFAIPSTQNSASRE